MHLSNCLTRSPDTLRLDHQKNSDSKDFRLDRTCAKIKNGRFGDPILIHLQKHLVKIIGLLLYPLGRQLLTISSQFRSHRLTSIRDCCQHIKSNSFRPVKEAPQNRSWAKKDGIRNPKKHHSVTFFRLKTLTHEKDLENSSNS